jgi:hypothetical protein
VLVTQLSPTTTTGESETTITIVGEEFAEYKGCDGVVDVNGNPTDCLVCIIGDYYVSPPVAGKFLNSTHIQCILPPRWKLIDQASVLEVSVSTNNQNFFYDPAVTITIVAPSVTPSTSLSPTHSPPPSATGTPGVHVSTATSTPAVVSTFSSTTTTHTASGTPAVINTFATTHTASRTPPIATNPSATSTPIVGGNNSSSTTTPTRTATRTPAIVNNSSATSTPTVGINNNSGSSSSSSQLEISGFSICIAILFSFVVYL